MIIVGVNQLGKENLDGRICPFAEFWSVTMFTSDVYLCPSTYGRVYYFQCLSILGV
jgi:hypothetical protein